MPSSTFQPYFRTINKSHGNKTTTLFLKPTKLFLATLIFLLGVLASRGINAGPAEVFRSLVDRGVPYIVVAPSGFINDKRGGGALDYADAGDASEIEGGTNRYEGGGGDNNMVRGFRFYGLEGPFGSNGWGLGGGLRSGMDKRYGYHKRLRDRYRMAFGLGKRRRRRRSIAKSADTSNRPNKFIPEEKLMPPNMYFRFHSPARQGRAAGNRKKQLEQNNNPLIPGQHQLHPINHGNQQYLGTSDVADIMKNVEGTRKVTGYSMYYGVG